MGHSHQHRAAYGERVRAEQAKLREFQMQAKAEQLKKQQRKDNILTVAVGLPLAAALTVGTAIHVNQTDFAAHNQTIAERECTKAERVLQNFAACQTCQQEETTDRDTLRHQEYHDHEKDWAERTLRYYSKNYGITTTIDDVTYTIDEREM